LQKKSRFRIAFLIAVVAMAVFASIAVGYAFSLSEKNDVPFGGERVNRPFPAFSLPDMNGKATDASILPKKGVAIVNVFASWCSYCAIEHPLWHKLREGNPGALIVGVAWADKPEALRGWLKKRGNPYSLVIEDPSGELAMDLGVTGAPETYLIKDGRIVARFAGAISEEMADGLLAPFLNAP